MTARVLAELLGTAFLLMIVVGSGIMGERLAGGNEAVALLANSLATGAGLFALIQSLGPISGAHFNPVVSLVETMWGRLKRRDLPVYWAAQLAGALLGVGAAHAMFGLPIFQVSAKARLGSSLAFAELVATFGLICAIALAGKKRVEWAPVTVAAYITSAYWFTSSTSFANPAVTVARAFTDTFAGIAPSGVVFFIVAQLAGALASFGLLKRLRE